MAKQSPGHKRISFLCPPKLLTYIQASRRACDRDQSRQIAYLLELALDLREHDYDVRRFKEWLAAYQANEPQRAEVWLRKELDFLKTTNA